MCVCMCVHDRSGLSSIDYMSSMTHHDNAVTWRSTMFWTLTQFKYLPFAYFMHFASLILIMLKKNRCDDQLNTQLCLSFFSNHHHTFYVLLTLIPISTSIRRAAKSPSTQSQPRTSHPWTTGSMSDTYGTQIDDVVKTSYDSTGFPDDVCITSHLETKLLWCSTFLIKKQKLSYL